MNEVIIYTTRMGDVDDVDLHMLPILETFYKTEQFKWLDKNKVIMKYRFHDTFDFYHTLHFIAEFESEELEFMYKLKFGNGGKYLDNQ